MVWTAERSALVGHSQDVLIGLRSVTSLIDDAVIAVRGFALSREEWMLEPYSRSRKQVVPALAKLKVLMRNDEAQLARAGELAVLVERRFALMEEMLGILRKHGDSKAWAFIKATDVDGLVERIRSEVDGIELTERGMLSRRVVEVSVATQLTYWLFVVGMIVNLVIILLAFRAMGREIERRGVVEATLRQSEARFRGTFEAAAVGMGVMSLDGRWLEVNAALCGIVGYQEDELLGMDSRMMTHPEDLELDAGEMTRVRAGHLRSCQYEKRYISKSGRTIPISISASLVADELRRVSYVVTLVEDISARKRAEARLAAQHAVALILAENRSLEESISAILRAIGSLLGYCVGEYWELDAEQGRLVARGLWWDEAKVEPDKIQASHWRQFSFGEGLPGLAWQGVEPVVIEDVTRDGRFVRAEMARAAGLRGAFGFAVVGSGGPIAVMTFLSREMAEEDAEFRATLFTVGRQIGLFVERRNAERAAAESANRIWAIFDKTVQFMGLLDRNGTLLEANQTALTFFGVTREKVIGHPFLDGPWCWGSHELRERLEQALRRGPLGETTRFEAVHVGALGQVMTVDFSLTPVRDERGEVVFMIAEGHDISVLKRTALALQESEEQFRLLLESVKDHEIIMLDPGGHVVSWNAAAEAIKGYRAEEIIGQHFSVFYPDDHGVAGANPDEVLETARSLGRWSGEGWRKRKDGSLFWANILVSPVWDHRGELRGFAKVTRDETERRQAESELLAAKEAAEAANRAKGEFLANVSHEIRTPMNGIIGMTELALETELSARQRDYLGLVRSSADSLLMVINDILDFSKIDAGKLELSPSGFSLRELVEETVRTLALRAHGKGLEVACSIAPRVPDAVIADSGRLRQIIVNLLGNAIKFTERGSILLEADLAEENVDDGNVILHMAIRDTGVGIAREKLWSIFQPFEQADNSTTRRFGGTGLGLTISRELVLLMGGRIWVESEVGAGSVFHFTVQLKRLAGTSEEGVRGRSLSAGMRILVVDGSEIHRRILTEVLASWGAESHELENGDKVIEELRSGAAGGRAYRAVIIDIDNCVVDRDALERSIRADAELKETVLLLMATDGSIEGQAGGGASEWTEWLSKPVRQSVLYDALARTNGGKMSATGGETRAAAGGEVVRSGDHGDSQRVRLKVLLAEDHPVNQKLAVRLLEKAGYEVTVVQDGQQALEAMEAANFDVVLMDVSMPVMSGFEAIERIRAMADEAKRRTPVIALTAHAMVGDRERCLARGFDGYVSKPVSGQGLREAISGVMGVGSLGSVPT
jgi:PAS domain S-box-containing protein